MKRGIPFKDYTPETCAEVFSALDIRQITALMFHDQMADYFKFLSLDGFAKLHKFQYLEESIDRRKLKEYYIKHHNKLLEEWEVSDPRVIPQDWLRYTRMDVSSQVRTQSTQSALKKYMDWEEETREILAKSAIVLRELECVSDEQFILCMLKDVDKELECLYKIINKLRAVSYDPVFVMEYQDELKRKYEEEIKAL